MSIEHEPKVAIWDGVTRSKTLDDWARNARTVIVDASKRSDWSTVLECLDLHDEFVNSWRPGGNSLYAPLHHAAYAGASQEIVERLVEKGAWRTLQNVRGERPLDVADRRGHRHLKGILDPVYRRRVPAGVLLKIQHNFHDVIRGRAQKLVRKHALRLPELEPLLELSSPTMWFAVPGMYGGFRFTLEADGVEARLVAESWCRVVEGSGQRHEVSSAGSRLVDEGFV